MSASTASSALNQSQLNNQPLAVKPSKTGSSAQKAVPTPAGQRNPAAKKTTPVIRARNALVIVLGILAVLWIVQVVNNADHYRLSYDYGIKPRMVADLPYILTAPFLHWSWAHIEGNSLPLLVLGFLVAYKGIPKFIGLTAVVILTSGLAAWLTSPTGADDVGASGVIFGWFGYVIVRGFFNHDKVDIFVGLLVMIYYLPIFTLLLPAPHLGYQAHIGGLIGGVLCGWVFRTRRSATTGHGTEVALT
jgi:membrane associated rhomboid family serine protease